jgi:chromosome segregation ATPase
VLCRRCFTTLRVRSIHEGHHVRCGRCQERFLIPKVAKTPTELATNHAGQPGEANGEARPHRAEYLTDGSRPAVAISELGALRDVLPRILSELVRVRGKKARYKKERNTIRFFYKKLRNKYLLLKSKRDEDGHERQRLDAELAGIRNALGHLDPTEAASLIAEHEELAQHHDLVVAELDRLQLDREEIHSQRLTLLSQLEQLSADRDQLRAEKDRAIRERERLDAELAGIRNALGHLDPTEAASLIAEHEELAQHRDLVVAELDRLRLDRDELETHRGALHSQLEQLRDDHDRLRAELDLALRDRERRDAELAEIRNALGPLDPAQAAALRGVQQALEAESAGLREQLRAVQDELSTKSGMPELVAQREGELQEARGLCERLGGQITHLEKVVADSVAERVQLNEEIQQQREQIEATRADRGRLDERFRERDESLASARADLEILTEQARGNDVELASMKAELGRQAEQLQASLIEAERLRSTLARTEELTRLENLQRQGQIESLRRAHDEAEQKLQEEKNSSANQLRTAREQLAAESSRRSVLEVRIIELEGALEKRSNDARRNLATDRSQLITEFPSASATRRSLREEALVEALMEIQLGAQGSGRPDDRPVAESLGSTPSQPPSGGELEVSRREVEELRKKLAEQEVYVRSVASMLDGMGIRGPMLRLGSKS